MKTRFLLIKLGCPYCRKFLKAVQRVNFGLNAEERIQIFDNWVWEELGVQLYPVMRKFEKNGFSGYPFCYIDGIIVEPAEPKVLEKYLKGLLQ